MIRSLRGLTLTSFCFVTLLSLFSTYSVSAKQLIKIGTGSLTGVYYPTGDAICKLINKDRHQHQTICTIANSNGSIDNLQALRQGKQLFVLTQSDWQDQAYRGQGPFEQQKPYQNLRAVFSLYPEPLHVLVRKNSSIKSLQELKGRRIHLGSTGSGDLATMKVLMDAYGWKKSDFKLAVQLPVDKRSASLCNNNIDASIYFVGLPSGVITQAIEGCRAKLVPADDIKVSDMIEAHPYYVATTIPAASYRSTATDIDTFAVMSTLVTDVNTPDEVVYRLTKAVFDNLAMFKQLHPALADLDPHKMIQDGISIPLHPGAIRYFKEVGLLKEQ